MLSEVEPGIYLHNKTGRYYYAFGVGKHSETLEDLVCYYPLYDSEVNMFLRPLSMWNEIIDGKPRFEFVDGEIEFVIEEEDD